jgi:alpha-tubulin suppressor-like RCC1 family protein
VVYCWGEGTVTGSANAPPTRITLPLPAVSVSVGDFHACAVLNNGSVRCWGSNGLGTLGNGNTNEVLGSALAALPDDARQVSASAVNTAAVTNDGSAFLWGAYTIAGAQPEVFGPDRPPTETQLVASPLLISDLGQVVDIGLGARHACAVLGSGQVVCWGSNDRSQLGRTTIGFSDTQSDTFLVPGIADAVNATSGDSYSCVVRATGVVTCWGSLFTSDLSDTSNLPPAAVPQLSNASQVSVGSSSACALRRDRTVSCWGGNAFGELGNGSLNGTLIPSVVSGLSDAVQISEASALGGRSFCALRSNGAVVCWGANNLGQLGDGTNLNRSTPVPVAGLPN